MNVWTICEKYSTDPVVYSLWPERPKSFEGVGYLARFSLDAEYAVDKQGARLGVLGLLDRLGDSLAGAGTDESLLVVSQHDFPC